MVVSLLDPKLNYNESKKIYDDDVSQEVSIYEVPIYNNIYDVGLGSTKYDYTAENILFIPIYLVVNNRVIEQIGLYELSGDNIAPYLDEDGDIDINKVSKPLMFSYATKDYLHRKSRVHKNEPMFIDTSIHNQEDSSDDEEEVNEAPLYKNPIPEQNTKQASKERKSYKEEKNDPWIRSFLKNPHINEIDNEGGGDCLFAVIRDAYATRGVNMSVKELREKLSTYATQDQYQYYRSQYEMYRDAVKTITVSMKSLNKQNEDLRKKLKSVSSREDQLKLVEESQKVKQDYEKAKEDKKFSQELGNEFSFMKEVLSLDDFKKAIKDPSYWADAWAISSLEDILKIKLILFSKESYESEDMSNVLLCGESGETIVDPKSYIMVSYTGNHYELITYYEHGLLDFSQLPYDVKLLIVNKCMEKLAGPYYDIPAFRLFQKKLGIKIDTKSEDPYDELEEINIEKDAPIRSDIIFQFYSNSSDKKKPGFGVGEKIPQDEVMRFSALANMKDWRRKLDNSWAQAFELDGHKWKSVDHFYNASKFIKNNPDYYETFSLDSDSELSKDVAMAIAAGSSSGKYNKQVVRPIDVKMDDDFDISVGNNKSRSSKEMQRAIEAKMTQNKDLQKLLLETQNATLQQFRRGKEPIESKELMNVRENLMNSK